MEVPDRLRMSAARIPGGEVWLEGLPRLLVRYLARWRVRVDGPAHVDGSCSYSVPVRTADDRPAVLKLGIPHEEAAHEAAVLRWYAGEGSVELLESDDREFALLLERCDPGTSLHEVTDPEEVVGIGTGVLTRLWRPPPSGTEFLDLGPVTARWSNLVVERVERHRPPWDPGVVRAGVVLLRDLPGSAGPPDIVVLHQDFHPGNVLAAQREPWLAIDPKPMVGDRAFDPVQLVMQVGDLLAAGDAMSAVRDRLGQVASGVDLDPSPLTAWALARSVEWAAFALHHGEPWAESSYRWAEVFARLLRD